MTSKELYTKAEEVSNHFVSKDFARQLALALADEVISTAKEAGTPEIAQGNSLNLLIRARDELDLEEELNALNLVFLKVRQKKDD